MVMQTCENGIYRSRSSFGPKTWPDNRLVYIEDGYVRLVDESCFKVEDPVWKGPHIFSYNTFFCVNDLGERVGDLPSDIHVREIK